MIEVRRTTRTIADVCKEAEDLVARGVQPTDCDTVDGRRLSSLLSVIRLLPQPSRHGSHSPHRT